MATTMDRAARQKLVERARKELPAPGDPRLLSEELLAAGLAGPEALEVLQRTTLAWTQLRDMKLEVIWQNGFGWFLARNLMGFGAIALVATLSFGIPNALLEAALAGAVVSYLFTMLLSPRRLRRHKHRRAGILAAYKEDLEGYLDGLG